MTFWGRSSAHSTNEESAAVLAHGRPHGIARTKKLRVQRTSGRRTARLLRRQSRPWPDELELVIADYGIRSIISLVPPEPEQSWYQGELLVSSSHQIARYELPLSPDVRPTSDQLRDLLFLMQEAPKPILIHSRSGADRTGLAAAMFPYAVASRPAGEAGRQLSIRYGHFPSVWLDTSVMDATFQEFVATRRPSTP